MNIKYNTAAAFQVLNEIITEIEGALDTDESSRIERISNIAGVEVIEDMTREEFLQEALEGIKVRIKKDVLPLIRVEVVKNESITNI